MAITEKGEHSVTRNTLAKAGIAIGASIAIAGGTAGSAFAGGPNVTASAPWGTATFKSNGDNVWVKDKAADGYSVQAWLYYSSTGDAPWAHYWEGCHDTTSKSNAADGYTFCNFEAREGMNVKVCIFRSKDGIRYPAYDVCSYVTKA